MRNSCVWEVTVEAEVDEKIKLSSDCGGAGALGWWTKNHTAGPKKVSHVLWLIADTPEQTIAALKKETAEKGYKFLQETCLGSDVEVKVTNINVTEIRRIRTVRVVDPL